ncbi:RagB/SusD family nutrient uptake outer membrane protein [Labilibaculum manganireducens]|uniref:RagB/SusD family nutrient uptake outer membrane protein n=1 Tax=Labilibaculum manganireducens TaxID=1940525 RepID=A0A2N3IDU2_9BACT|nr:RagB/SusD family nutrient uptake outer membrane protein [Labilibaculum manganireducens]PKQ68476.1 RagB/SusD family nutrient uptake outer membrane protein [Labilibaculum manganireducens]
MKRYIIYVLVLFTSLCIISCDDEILDVDPVDTFTDAAVWNDLALAESYLNTSYTKIKAEAEKGSRFASLSEEIFQMHTYGTENVRQGYLSSDNSSFGWEDDMWNPWDYFYGAIKDVNLFLENIKEVPTPSSGDDIWKNDLIGQGHFLRAYFYFQLYSLYGRVPLISQVYPLDTKEFTETRASLEDVASFIVTECDSAANLLPLEYSNAKNFGRATKGAALMLKGRTLLFAASPLYDKNYPDQIKWQKAADANKAVLDLHKYSLQSISNSDEYASLFLDSKNPEIIFEKLYDKKYVAGSNNVFLHQAPCGTGNGFQGWGTLQPTHNVVSKFQMSDGSKYIPNKNTEKPWDNRDLRLHATIFVDGDNWGFGDDNREIEFFVSGEAEVDPGKDSREGPSWWNATQTGYGLKKFLDPNYDNFGTNANTTPWIYMRLAEVYLNYAECLIELHKNPEALIYINLVRERSLLPPAEGVDIRAEYEYERQIELLFEGQRWFDIRRWKQAEEIYKTPIEGINIKKFKDGSKTYELKSEAIETRNFYAPKNYWMPIPRSELRKAPQLDATPYE